MRKVIVSGIFVVLALVFVIAGYHVVKILWDNHQNEKNDESQQNQYVTVLPTKPSITQGPTQNPEAVPAPTEPEQQVPPIAVDFKALKETNEDVVGWLYCEGTYIHYPVVQGEDNSYYLRKDLKGNYLISGTLFVDYRNRELGRDKNYIIYGHNMKTDRMFGSLVKYKDQAYYEAHPTLFYLTPEGDYLIEAVAGRIVDEQEIFYDPNPDPGAYWQFLENTLANSTFDSGITLTEADKLMILSTCSQENVSTRYVLICKYTPIEK